VASYAAIAEASETVVELLRNRIGERSDVISVDRSEIALVSPADIGADSDVRLSVFLYDVTENSAMKNPGARPPDAGTKRQAPVAVDLRYLVTAFPSGSGGDETSNTLDQQRVLGLAMQVIHDNSHLGADELPASLAERDIQITLEEQPTGEVADIWSTFPETPVQPSVSYRLSPVLIDSRSEKAVEPAAEWGQDYKPPGQ
jgi:hypothetical protein